MLFGVFVNSVIGKRNDDGAADKVAEGDEEEVGGDSGERQIGAKQCGERQEEHVSDAMFKAAEDKKHDWEPDGEDFAGDRLGGGCHPDGEDDEDVAENATSQHGGDTEGDFGFGEGGGGGGSCVGECAGKADENGKRDGAEEIAKPDDSPTTEKLSECDFAVQASERHEVVAGEKFGASEDDQDEANWKDGGAEEFCKRRVEAGGKEAAEAAKANEETGEHRKNEG